MDARAWSVLPVEEWGDTLATLHLWTQVVGKIRMARSAWLNHSWGVTLSVTPRGLTTGLVPYGDEAFEISFDLVSAELSIETSTAAIERVELGELSVATFYATVMKRMAALQMPVSIDPMPSEIADAVPFQEDTEPGKFDPDHARLLLRAMLDSERVFSRFRAGFIGKASPVQLFWGAFDLATSQYSGRTAPPHPGGAPNFPLEVAREAYSHEVTAVGFWPGNAEQPAPIYYAYAYPAPDGFAAASVSPSSAFWLEELGEFVLPYDAVRSSADPDGTLLGFLRTTHAAAADLAGWDRQALEAQELGGPDWWRERPHT